MAALTDEQFHSLTLRLGTHGVVGLRSLPGGASSVTFTGVRAGQRVVVKVAPPGVAPTLNRDVLRQARILRSLGQSGVPVPEVLVEDRGDPPDIPPFFVMSFLAGTSMEPLFDLGAAPEEPNVIGERLRAAARAMARLHRVEPSSLGLEGEPVVGPSQEIERWSRSLETVDPGLVAGWQKAAAALRESVPPALPPAIVHGDFRLGNLLAEGEHVTAIIDWEIWSVGDPRLDVGWFLVNADPATYRRPTPYAGSTPLPAELADVYAEELGGAVPQLNWFQGLACFKSTATWSLIVKHNRRRATPDPAVEELAAVLPSLLARSTSFLTSNGSQHFSPNGG